MCVLNSRSRNDTALSGKPVEEAGPQSMELGIRVQSGLFFQALEVRHKEGNWGGGLSSSTITVLPQTALVQPHEKWGCSA